MRKLAPWFRQDIPGKEALTLAREISGASVNTVCREAKCPNLAECFKRNQATFIILGRTCTRHCAFCNIRRVDDESTLENVDLGEPKRIALLARSMGLRYVVITSVTRDDLADGGAKQFVNTAAAIRSLNLDIKIEFLIPDFKGNNESLFSVINAKPFVLAHNLETVKRLYKEVRPEACYQRSLDLLKRAKDHSKDMFTKSSLMLGLGESEDEVILALKDLLNSGCDILTLGQYLSPSPGHYQAREYVDPLKFQHYAKIGLEMGFKKVFSGPKVRSSYMAEELSRELVYV